MELPFAHRTTEDLVNTSSSIAVSLRRLHDLLVSLSRGTHLIEEG
jgi:hypothetical protein